MAARPISRPPWKRKHRARAAGHRYPNLVDNMAVARKRKTKAPGSALDHRRSLRVKGAHETRT